MERHDTVTLNQHVLATRLRELELKQWWLARQIGVTRLTVNRWLTGKVRRINRDNLERLAQLLQCDESELASESGADLVATQREQSDALRVLDQRATQDIFMRAEQGATYETLLKSVMHPNLPLRDLAMLYSNLTIAASVQGDVHKIREYASLCLDYALRSGATEHEFSSRNNLIVTYAQEGNLVGARSGLEELVSAAESVGLQDRRHVAMINLTNVYRMMGLFTQAIQGANECIAYFRAHSQLRGTIYAFSNSAALALDLGRYQQALDLRRMGEELGHHTISKSMELSGSMFRRMVESMLGHTEMSSADDKLVKRYLGDMPEFADGHAIWPAVLYRRAGRLDEAWQICENALEATNVAANDRPFSLEEQARVAVAQKKTRLARKLREEANGLLTAAGMPKRCCEDPAAEIGQQFKPPRLRLQG